MLGKGKGAPRVVGAPHSEKRNTPNGFLGWPQTHQNPNVPWGRELKGKPKENPQLGKGKVKGTPKSVPPPQKNGRKGNPKANQPTKPTTQPKRGWGTPWCSPQKPQP